MRRERGTTGRSRSEGVGKGQDEGVKGDVQTAIIRNVI